MTMNRNLKWDTHVTVKNPLNKIIIFVYAHKINMKICANKFCAKLVFQDIDNHKTSQQHK